MYQVFHKELKNALAYIKDSNKTIFKRKFVIIMYVCESCMVAVSLFDYPLQGAHNLVKDACKFVQLA